MRYGIVFLACMGLSGSMAWADAPLAKSADASLVHLMVAPQPPPPVIVSEAWGGHVSYVAGYKGMDSKWKPADSQIDVGALDLDLRPPDAPFSVALQALVSLSSEGPDTLGQNGGFSRTTELNIGLRKVFDNPSVLQPFIGGGLAIVNADAKSKTADGTGSRDDAWAVGAWGGAGVYWHLTNELHLGLGVQYTWARGELFNEKLNLGGLHGMIMFGVHW